MSLQGMAFCAKKLRWLPQDTNRLFRLEERRRVKGAAYYERKKAARRQLVEATKNAKVDKNTKKELAKYGY